MTPTPITDIKEDSLVVRFSCAGDEMFAAMADYARKLERVVEAYDEAMRMPIIEDFDDDESYHLACDKVEAARQSWLDIKNEVCR